MKKNEFSTMTFEQLAELIQQRYHLALLRNGAEGMRTEFWSVYSIIQQWQEVNVKKSK
jgi:hypothetical protein